MNENETVKSYPEHEEASVDDNERPGTAECGHSVSYSLSEGELVIHLIIDVASCPLRYQCVCLPHARTNFADDIDGDVRMSHQKLLKVITTQSMQLSFGNRSRIRRPWSIIKNRQLTEELARL